MSIKKVVIIGITIMIVIGIMVILINSKIMNRRYSEPDMAQARKLLHHYLYALETKNQVMITQLIPRGYSSTQEILGRIKKYGGASANEAVFKITNDIKPQFASVKISTTGHDGQSLVWIENLFWKDSTWWLILGSVSDSKIESSSHRFDQ